MPSWPGTARTDGDVAGVAGRRPGMTVAEAVDGLPRRVASWGAAMSLAPTSLTGISLALGVCAAVWFTAGSTLGYAAGALALSGSYLAGRPARQLAGRPGGGTRGWQPAAKAVSDRRLALACAALTECGAYASLAAAGPAAGALAAAGLVTGGLVTSPAAGWSGTWQLATTTVIMVAVSQLAVACASPADRKSTRLNSSHVRISYAVFCW